MIMSALDAYDGLSASSRMPFTPTLEMLPNVVACRLFIEFGTARLHNHCRETISTIDFMPAKSHKNVTKLRFRCYL